MTQFAITNARILAGPADTPATNGSVLVVDGTISAVAPDGDFGATEVIDAGGKTLMPGLINAHGHITMDSYDLRSPRKHNEHGDAGTALDALWRCQLSLQAGVTTIRDCMTTSDGIWQVRRQFEAGHFLGPRLVLSGRAVVITGGHMHYIAETADGADDFRRKVRAVLGSGADLIKIAVDNPRVVLGERVGSQQMSAEEIRAVVDTAHDLGHRVAAHSVTSEGLQRAVDAGVDSIEHGYQVDETIAPQMADKGIWLVPTFSVPITLKQALAKDAATEKHYDDEVAKLGQALRHALAAGVRVAAGNDAGSPGNHLWGFPRELLAMQEAGMPAAQVVESATSGAAELLGVQDNTGRIAPGLDADLILVDGNPDQDVSVLQDIAAVYRGGQLIDAGAVAIRPHSESFVH